MSNAGTHVPLIVDWKGKIKQGLVCDDLIDFSDFVPTFAEAAGASLPADRLIDGIIGHARSRTGGPDPSAPAGGDTRVPRFRISFGFR